MADIYIRLDYEAYKAFEQACKEFKETVHTTLTGYYHKSIRLPLGDKTWLEIHGPGVKADENC